MLATIKRMYFRDNVPLREIARRMGLHHNTIRTRLRQPVAVEPEYPKRLRTHGPRRLRNG
ncbi:hypothetical protein [Paraburkholderia dinghuensis]|uniref:Uncharacterized protein n=1 Tax=Paraburkholderia dinghuensis TaxID=2305225 RepID=A0A3N6N050_9BURK|nr:hypothetical protein [Paraburkholderia dinghuensis]RQH02182.1 hypothetical protein D1Y85_22125 [Paraburkholderia dinghuensis]